MTPMMEEDGWGITVTPEIYTLSEYKSIGFVEDKSCPVFAATRILSTREWLPLMGITLPFTMIPSEFFALIKGGYQLKKP